MPHFPPTNRAARVLLAAAALTLPTSTVAAAAPSAGAATGKPTSTRASGANASGAKPQVLVTNGDMQVGTECTGESQNQSHRLGFYERPSKICVVWKDKHPTEWARWSLFVQTPTATGTTFKPVASGEVPDAALPGTFARFSIDITKLMPRFNTASKDKIYHVHIDSKRADVAKPTKSTFSAIVHHPKADVPVEPPIDPYKCTGSASQKRRVVIDLPVMTVVQTTQTNGDGDRDELYFLTPWMGPNSTHGTNRLPDPEAGDDDDDYYEAKNGKTVKAKQWTNRHEHRVTQPVLFDRVVKHGETYVVTIGGHEQDNSDLANIRSSLMEAMQQVVKAALESNNSYGAAVAAVAAALDMAFSLIPQTKGQDVVLNGSVIVSNKCGHVVLTWATFEELKIGNDKLSNSFPSYEGQSSTGYQGRSVVIVGPSSGFSSGGPVDWGPHLQVESRDEFIWAAEGTGSSSYMFTVRARSQPQ